MNYTHFMTMMLLSELFLNSAKLILRITNANDMVDTPFTTYVLF